jgi:hypothetical protein
MQISFQCPHCSQLFDASPEMYGQTCACQKCAGLFFVPALDSPSDSVEGDLGSGSVASDEGAFSPAIERRQLALEMDELRRGVSLKEEECGRLIAERDNLQNLSQSQAAALREREAEIAESGRLLHSLRQEFEAREKLLGIAEEKSRRSDERLIELTEELRRFKDLEDGWKKAANRVHQLESDAAENAEKLERERINGNEFREKLILIQRERDAFAEKIKELSLSLEQASNKVVEFENQAAKMTLKFEEANEAANREKQERTKEANTFEEQLRGAVARVEQLEEASSRVERELEEERTNRRKAFEKLVSAEKEREAFLESSAVLKAQLEQSLTHSSELEMLTQELKSKLEKFRQAADARNEKHQADLRAHEEQLKDSRRHIANLESDYAVRADELKKAQHGQFSAIKKLEIAEAERDALSASLEAMRVESEQASQRRVEQEKAAAELVQSSGDSSRAVDYHKNKAIQDSRSYEERVDALVLRIAQGEAACAGAEEEVANLRANRIKILEQLAAAEKERDDLRKVVEALRYEVEQSLKQTRKSDECADGLGLQNDQLLKSVGATEKMDGGIFVPKVQLEKVTGSEKYWRDQPGVFESKAAVAAGQVSRLEADILEAKNLCEALRVQVKGQREDPAQTLTATNHVNERKEVNALKARITELEMQECARKEKEVDLQRALAAEVEELELMHHRMIQIEQIGKDGSFASAALSLLRTSFWRVADAPGGLIYRFFPRLAVCHPGLRRVVIAFFWAFLSGVFLFVGGSVTDKNFEFRGERSSPGPGDLVETIPVLRDIESDKARESAAQGSTPPADSNERGRVQLAAVPIDAGSADALSPNPKEIQRENPLASNSVSSLSQVDVKGMQPSEIAQTSDAATQLDSSASVVRKEPMPIGEVLIEGKETLKNLNRTPLPSHFLGTPFGTAMTEVANLANWTESSGRLRRKATLVGALVEAVLIPDHEKRVMAGAYVRICPRSTESLAPFLEWAVGVQDAIDAEYGEASSVHEVGEADDAAGVVERIASGKDFYEAMWERQSDDGLIVLSIRTFNERSVVFRLEYLNRSMLAAYTEQQKAEAPQKSEDASQQKERAPEEQSKPVQN